MHLSRYVIIASLGAAAACASSAGGAGASFSPESSQDKAASGRHGDSRLLTEADLASATQSNLFDIIQAQRPRWLELHGVSSLNRMSSQTITVFVNDTKLGGTDALRSLGTGDVKAVRYYDASASQAKFPGRGLGPVIQVVRK